MPPEFDFVYEIMAFLNEALSIVLTDLGKLFEFKILFSTESYSIFMPPITGNWT